MKRLVYSPSISVWVKTDTGVIDLSPYITGFKIDRRVNQVSSANLTFRNPKIKSQDGKLRHIFTENMANDGSVRPMFHPMDPIIITLTRLKGRPIQVFTGYCDTTPYVQLYPGVASMDASCTLKRLLYTYWDPGLPFIREFMDQNGWGISKSGLTINPTAEGSTTPYLNDSSIGGLLYNVLKEVGGWKNENIYIQELPGKNIGQLVANLYKDIQKEEASSIKDFHAFLEKIIGKSAYGGAGSGNNNDSVDPNSVPKGGATFEGTTVASWIKPILVWAKQNGWNGSITSGYRTAEHNAEIGGATNSNHIKLDYPGGAIDVGDVYAESAGQALYDVIKRYPHKPNLVWAKTAGVGYGGSKIDYGHFSAAGD